MSSQADLNQGVYKYAENLCWAVSSNPSALSQVVPSTKGTIHDKLMELYLRYTTYHSNHKPSSTTRIWSNLLSKLVQKDKLNTLIINLKRVEEGYSIVVRSSVGELVETADFSYTENDLLEYIENEEIPHNLVDLFEQSQPSLFYDGCIIAEIRDMRRSLTGSYKTSYILLKPSYRSLLADMNTMTNDKMRWSQDDRFNLESKLLIATNEPLCLDPSPAVNIVKNRQKYKQRILNSHLLRHAMKPYSAIGILKQRILARLPAPRTLGVVDYLASRGNKSRYKFIKDYKMTPIDCWRSMEPVLTSVDTSDVQKLAKELEKPSWQIASGPANKPPTDCSLSIVEEYILETERPQGRVQRARLVIQQRQSEDKYTGELYVERDDSNANKCSFALGTEILKNRYIQQFIEIFTEEGRRQVKIVHNVPGTNPQVSFTSGHPLAPAVGTTTLNNKPAGDGQVLPQLRAAIPAVGQNVTSLPAALGAKPAQPGTTVLMTKPGTNATQISTTGINSVQILGIQHQQHQNSTSGHVVQGTTTPLNLQNLQVSLTGLSGGQTGITAVPVSLFSNMSSAGGNQPILLSGPITMVDSANQHQISGVSQASSNSRPVVVSSQVGAQPLISGQRGLITIPVTSNLQVVQQLLAASNKNRLPQTTVQQANNVQISHLLASVQQPFIGHQLQPIRSAVASTNQIIHTTPAANQIIRTATPANQILHSASPANQVLHTSSPTNQIIHTLPGSQIVSSSSAQSQFMQIPASNITINSLNKSRGSIQHYQLNPVLSKDSSTNP